MRRFSIIALTILGVLLLNAGAFAQCVSLTTPGSAYTQNFDTLSNTAGSTTNNLTITGWFMTESGGGARDNEQYAVDTGASTTGDTYSYGAAGNTERSLGGLRSGTLFSTIGSCYTNNTGTTISSLNIAYTGEEWRLGTAGRTDQLNFEYSANATDLVTGTWTGVPALNFVTPDTATTGAKNGNAAPARTALSSTISSLSIANGATFWIRWTDTDASSADDGLAVDDFSLTPQAIAPPPNLSINDVSLNEGNSETTTYSFTVSLSSPAPAGGVTFDIATADGTATAANADYTSRAINGINIPAGGSSYTFDVSVTGDTAFEPTETFFVNVLNVTGANVTDGQGQGTIVNDDADAGTFGFASTGYGGTEGVTLINFNINRTGGTSGAAVLNVGVGSATGTVAACGSGGDVSTTDTTVQFSDGQTTASGGILVCDDSIFELSETVTLTITSTSAGTIGSPSTATVTIDDDDPEPTFSINSVAQAEGSNGTSGFVFTVTKSGATAVNSTVEYATIDDTATVADGDYQAASGTLTFLPNETTKTVTVTVNGDQTIEDNETFIVRLANATNAFINNASGFGSVLDDDNPAPAMVEFAEQNYAEDESQTLALTVNRSGNISGTTTVQYGVQQFLGAGATGGASCSTAGVDYVTPNGTLTFAPGETAKDINVQICGDTLLEPSEYFSVELSNVTNGTLGSNSNASIQINDTASQFANADGITIGSGTEGNPYPSEINVSGAPSSITSMRLTLYDFSHFSSERLDLLLVGPEGQKFMIMADAGGANGLSSEATITLSDDAGRVLPDSSQISSGKYEPTSWETGQSNFPAPAPAGPYVEPGSTIGGAVTFASVFGGTNPNGTWRLYVRDDGSGLAPEGIGGEIRGGWGLQFAGPTAAGVSVGGQLRAGKTPIGNATVMLTGGSLTEPLLVKTNNLGNYLFENVTAGQTYIVTVMRSRYNFPQSSMVINVDDNVLGADFEAEDR